METAKGITALTVFGFSLILAKVFNLSPGGLALTCLIGATTGAAALHGARIGTRRGVFQAGFLWGTVGVVFFLAYWYFYRDLERFYLTLAAGYIVGPSLMLAVYYLRRGSHAT